MNQPASKVHIRSGQKSQYAGHMVKFYESELSRYALKQLSDEERGQYYKDLSQHEKTFYGNNGVRVEIYRDSGEWAVTGFDPDGYQDCDNRAETWEDALLIGGEMIFDLEDMYDE